MCDAAMLPEGSAFQADAQVYNHEILLEILGDLCFQGTPGFLSYQVHLVLLQSNLLRSVEQSSAVYGENTFPCEDRKRISILQHPGSQKLSTGTLRSQLPSQPCNFIFLIIKIIYVLIERKLYRRK